MAASSFAPVGSRFRRLRSDRSQPGIVRALKAAGASVEVIPGAGGRPDLLVGFRGQTYLLECKTPGRAKHDKAHRLNQERWRAAWRGGPVAVVETPDQALAAVGAMP